MPLASTRLSAGHRALLALAALAAPLSAQSPADRAHTAVLIVGQQGTLPIPTLMEGPAASTANMDIADQLFLRLAIPGPTLTTSGDGGFIPQLARSWRRRDSVTLAFDLDPRARWHDGTPVTSRDVVFTFDRARDSTLSPRLSRPLRYVDSVWAEGDQRVVVRFARPYAEQLYDATWHVQPLPAHLVARLSPAELARSGFVRAPVGSGPYRWVRTVPGQLTELAAVPGHFLGTPDVARVLFRVAADADARLNLLLSGEGEALENVIPPMENQARIAARPRLRLVTIPSRSVGYLLFNFRDPDDRARPHPILSDVRVRRAIVRALDREAMVRSAFGPYAKVPIGPVSPILWIGKRRARPERRDLREARRLLAEAGWRDTDGDGILDRNGTPLALELILPVTSAPRRQIGLQAQAQLREVGIRLDVAALEGQVWFDRRSAGRFDIDFSSASQDPSPTGLVQSWTCLGIGGSNVGGYCNPAVDSLMERAIFGQGDVAPLWHAAVDRIEADAPAAFMYAPAYVVAVDRRFDDLVLRPESPWLLLSEWTVRAGGARDAGRH